MLWRSVLAEMAAPRPSIWYGEDPRWRLQLEATARAVHGNNLAVAERPGRRLHYRVWLDVTGPAELVQADIVFYADPPHECYGQAPRDYPRVWAQVGASSKHRMPGDGALCLWYPQDPLERRWTSEKGLLDLLDIIVDHLLYEAHWRATGAEQGGHWPGDEAEHGFNLEAA
jgi:hypothetical protein